MIRLSDELEKFPPIDLKGLEERTGSIPDDVKNSIILYNKALGNLGIGNEDIAIIELKKAVSINPQFYEAMNLLGLCYCHTNDNGKASELFKKVIKAEGNSVRALEYLKMLDGNQETAYPSKVSIAKKSSNIASAQRAFLNTAIKNFTKREKKLSDVIKYCTVFLAGGLLVFLVQLPAGTIPKSAPASTANDIITASPAPVNEYEENYNKLAEEYQKLQKDLQQANSELEYYRNAAKLEQAVKLASTRSYEEAADLLVLLRSVEFNGSEKEKFDKLISDILPRATWIVHQEGMRLYYNRSFSEAASKLTKVMTYGGNWDYMPEALYHLGMSYASLNEKSKALESFKKLKEKYPNSGYTSSADKKIAELGG